MPPKVKFQKEEIVAAAADVVRQKGAAALTTREVAARLGVSTRPIFTYFDSMEQLKAALYDYVEQIYGDCVRRGLDEPIPFLGVGKQYIRFARQEPQLYKFLFLIPPEGTSGGAMQALRLSQDLARESLMRIYRMDAKTADRYFRNLWLVVYSFAALIVTGQCPYSDDQIASILTEFSLSICKAYKEIPGLPEGNFDRDAIFRELVQR